MHYEVQVDITNWLAVARGYLVAKSDTTDLAENCHPIACLNIMYNLYTSCLRQCPQNHCESKDTLADNKAERKK